jgi:hypothetical protein
LGDLGAALAGTGVPRRRRDFGQRRRDADAEFDVGHCGSVNAISIARIIIRKSSENPFL